MEIIKRRGFNVMILFEGMEYDYINKLELNKGIIDLGYNAGGSQYTSIPVSPAAYRKKHHMEYSLTHKSIPGFSIFELIDDWGKPHVIKISETPENMSYIKENKRFCGGK